MEAGGSGEPGGSVLEPAVEAFSTQCGNVTIQSRRTEGSTVKASVCGTDHVTLRTVQTILVSRSG